MTKTNRWDAHEESLSKAKAYCNEAGLVVRRIPTELFSLLKTNLLVVCGGDLLPANVEGLESRWWVTFTLEDRHRICSTLLALEQSKGIRVKQKLKSRYSFGNSPIEKEENRT